MADIRNNKNTSSVYLTLMYQELSLAEKKSSIWNTNKTIGNITSRQAKKLMNKEEIILSSCEGQDNI